MHAFGKHARISELCIHMQALDILELCMHMHALWHCACICSCICMHFGTCMHIRNVHANECT
jgi:hypothetical protein